MTLKQEKELTGFDPLAWMSEEPVEQEASCLESEEKVEDDANNVKEVVDIDSTISDLELTNVDETVSAEPVIHDANDNAVNESKILLDATLSIQKVSVLYDQFLKLLETHNTIEIDASEVVSIDTAVLQLLTVLKKTGIELDKAITIDFPSDRFIEAADLLGLSELLEVDHAAAGFF